jgi:deazaflavin-dependent oxidoreductase (nitroreductase family)
MGRRSEPRSRLKRVDPAAGPGFLGRSSAAIANTPPGRWFSIHVLWRIDPWLMRISRGRVGLGFGIPTALLETTGARTGAPRANAVIYFHDGERVTIVASKLGLPQNPAWLHNLTAHPEVVLGGERMRAEVVTDPGERRRLWSLADRVFAPYADYRRRAQAAGRQIPLVQLYPIAS